MCVCVEILDYCLGHYREPEEKDPGKLPLSLYVWTLWHEQDVEESVRAVPLARDVGRCERILPLLRAVPES